MIFRNRQQTIDGLAIIGSSLCCYLPGHGSPEKWPDSRCDCKYGASNFNGRLLGEGTGCPEVRSVHRILSAITDSEWESMVARADGVLSGWFLRQGEEDSEG